MSGRSGREDETLPVFDAVEPVEAGAVLRGSSRRGGGPARGAGVAAAMLVVLIGGIAVGNLEKKGDTTPSPSPSGIHVVAGPTGAGSSCEAQAAERSPTLSLSVTGVPRAVDALFGSAYHSGQEVLITPTWLVPSLRGALYVQPQDTFEVSTNARACIRSIAVSYKPTAALTPGPAGDGLFEEIFRPPAQVVTFEGIPVGDWVLRAEAHFEMLGADPGAEIVTVSYFRVIAGVTPTVTDNPDIAPVPTPVATPAVPCGSTAPTPNTSVVLVGGIGDPVLGLADVVPVPPEIPAAVPLVAVRVGDPVEIEVDGAACATGWDIELLETASGSSAPAYVQANPGRDPSVASQNQWLLSPTIDQVVVARLEFANGVTLVRTWQLAVQPFDVPVAFLVAKEGSRFAASAGCGLTITLANGYSTGDSCGSIGYGRTNDALHVRAYEPVTFEIPGWGVRGWTATCGRVVVDQGNEAFESSNGCALGGASSDATAGLVGPVTFVLRPGDTIVRIDVNAIGPNGNLLNETYYARVIAT